MGGRGAVVLGSAPDFAFDFDFDPDLDLDLDPDLDPDPDPDPDPDLDLDGRDPRFGPPLPSGERAGVRGTAFMIHARRSEDSKVPNIALPEPFPFTSNVRPPCDSGCMSARLLHLPLPAAAEPPSPWGAPPEPGSNHGPALVPSAVRPSASPSLPEPPPLPPASLGEARSLRDALAGLLSRERAASADFLAALSDFDQRRGWEALGHRSLFAFLSRELHLSDGAAYVRISAARLLPQFPAVEAALRDGRLCLSTAGSLAAVLTSENQAERLPLFFGLSARQAKELAATLVPRADPPRREVLTRIEPGPLRTYEAARPPGAAGAILASLAPAALRTCEVQAAPPISTSTPASTPAPASTIEPLSAELHRLHLTVSSRLVQKLASAKDGLTHALPGASTEQVIEAALDLLLEKQARRKGLVKTPRRPAGAMAGLPAASPPGAPARPLASAPVSSIARAEAGAEGFAEADGGVCAAAGAPKEKATVRPRYIPAAIRREVWLRDGQRCQFPLDSGGTCGAKARLELDHLVPLALGGLSTAANLRVVCCFHNQAAARAILGGALVEDQRARRAR